MAVNITAYALIVQHDDGSRIEISTGLGGDLCIRLADANTRTASGSCKISFDDFWNACHELIGPPGEPLLWEDVK